METKALVRRFLFTVFTIFYVQVGGPISRGLHPLGCWGTQQRQWGGTVRPDEQTSRYGHHYNDTHTYLWSLNGFTVCCINDELRLVQVDGMTPTAAGP